MPRRLASILLPLFGVCLASCVTYTQIPTHEPTPGDEVRVRLTQDEAERLRDRTGRRVERLEGRVQPGAPVADSLRMMVTWGAAWAGTPMEGRRDLVTLPRSSVIEMERKEISRSRTAALGVALAAAVVVLFRSVGSDGDGQSGGLPPDGPPPPVDL